MKERAPQGERKSGFGSWIVPILIAFLFICWGLLVFLAVGDKGPPTWDFGTVPDIPGQSAFSTEPPGAADPTPQHVNR